MQKVFFKFSKRARPAAFQENRDLGSIYLRYFAGHRSWYHDDSHRRPSTWRRAGGDNTSPMERWRNEFQAIKIV